MYVMPRKSIRVLVADNCLLIAKAVTFTFFKPLLLIFYLF